MNPFICWNNLFEMYICTHPELTWGNEIVQAMSKRWKVHILSPETHEFMFGMLRHCKLKGENNKAWNVTQSSLTIMYSTTHHKNSFFLFVTPHRNLKYKHSWQQEYQRASQSVYKHKLITGSDSSLISEQYSPQQQNVKMIHKEALRGKKYINVWNLMFTSVKWWV